MEEKNKKSTLDERKEALKSRRKKVQQMHYIMLSLTCLLIVIIPIFIWKSSLSGSMLPIFLAYMVMPISMLPATRNRLRDIEQDLKGVEFEIDLQQYQISIPETRAEKVLRINDSQLQRYYNVNLSQNMWVFGLGIFCILLGVK